MVHTTGARNKAKPKKLSDLNSSQRSCQNLRRNTLGSSLDCASLLPCDCGAAAAEAKELARRLLHKHQLRIRPRLEKANLFYRFFHSLRSLSKRRHEMPTWLMG